MLDPPDQYDWTSHVQSFFVSSVDNQMWLQVTDISQYGDIAAAQSVLVPAGAKVVDKSTTKVQQPPRNTGTLAGVFQAPPTTVYRCSLTPIA